MDRLGNPIPYGDTPNEKNKYDAEDLSRLEECDNQQEIQGVTTPYPQDKIPGTTTPEEEENITEMEIPE